MGKSTTPSFILELALETKAHDEADLNARFEVARQLYNACLDEAKRRLFLLRQSKDFQKARKIPVPPGLGSRDLSYIAQVKDVLRRARDLIKFIQYSPSLTDKLKQETERTMREIISVEKDLLNI